MNLQESIPVHIKRRIHLIDKVIDNLLPNMYPCDYNSSDHFVEGVLDEVFYFFRDEPDFYGLDLISINDFILDYKYDELTDYFNERCIVLKNNNLQESIRRIFRESLESEWNEGNYDYQHGFCHYFAYNIIDKIRERFPNKKVNYYLLLANEVNKDTDEVEQDYLLHVYIKIGDKLLDSNGFTTMDEVEQRVDDWYNRQLTMTPEEYDINVWEEESDEIPEMFFNNQFCNTKRVKEDMEKFLSHPSVQKLLKDTLNESVPPQVRRRHDIFDNMFTHYRDYFINHEYRTFKSFWNTVLELSLETLYYSWFSETVSDDDWEESAEYIEDYLTKKFYYDTKKRWEQKHHNKLNESEEKKSRLLSNIEKDGLFQVMQDTGLSMGQIILKYDNLPREVFERYIKDFIRHDGYHQTDGSVQLGYEIEIQTHVYTEHFYMEGDRVTVEIRRFDNRGRQTEGYIESLSNFTDEEIFTIVDDMSQWGKDNYFDSL